MFSEVSVKYFLILHVILFQILDLISAPREHGLLKQTEIPWHKVHHWCPLWVHSMLSACLLPFLTHTELCIMNLFQKDLMLMNITTLTNFGICRTMYCQSDLKSEIHRIAFPAMKTQLITFLFLCVNFGPRTNDHYSIPFLLTRCNTLSIFPFPKLKMAL
jgi:hypothetical protein